MTNIDIGRYGKRIVQMFWDPELKKDDNSPIWCLGREYRNTQRMDKTSERPTDKSLEASTRPTSTYTGSSNPHGAEGSHVDTKLNHSIKPSQGMILEEQQWPEPFLNDFESRLWFTYRSGFPNIPKSGNQQVSEATTFSSRFRSQLANSGGFVSDTGWGCMIRSGQCVLANALAMVRFGRDFSRGQMDSEERALLALFADDPRAPFSIHRFVEHGALACGTHPGQWFGPSATAQCIEELSRSFDQAGLKVYVTGDAPDVYEDTLLKVAKAGTDHFHPTLLLVGTRLGIDRITPAYRDALKAALQMPQSVGIAGGRPSSSHYFVGTQGSYLFYLDPHQTRPALPFHENPSDYTEDDVNSCHTRRLRRLNIDDVDPSMLIAFLFRDEGEWHSWKRSVGEAPGKAIFHIASSAPVNPGQGLERESALDEVETFDDEDDEDSSLV